jgi:hypothetical protein
MTRLALAAFGARCAGIALLLPSLWAGLAYGEDAKQRCIDANVRSQDLRRDGKLSAARDALRACAVPACPAMVRNDCTKRLDELEKAQPSVIFEVRDGAGNDLVSVNVTVDGQPFAGRLGGAPVPVDPGEHTFVFEVPGQPRFEKKLVLREGEQGRLERVTIGTAPEPAKPPPTEAPSPGPATRPIEGSSSGLGFQKVLAIGAGVVGVAGLGVGSAFGLVALSKRDDAEKICPGNLCPDTTGSSKWSDAKTAGNVATVAFVVGGVSAAAGVVLWLTAPSVGQGVRVGFGPGSVQVGGRW